ncbi:potassium channel family protein [Kitasatospora sp. NPDC097643]|uniref:potassium channel family protein n=1 Tax=Kitasatospora sp. NPDC097643 TaxID=3157230 RepID=UPI0033324623
MPTTDNGPNRSRDGRAARAGTTAGSRRAGGRAAERASIRRARRAAEWGRAKYAGSWAAPRGQAEARPTYRRIVWTVLRVVGAVAVLVTVYYLLPLDHSSTTATTTMLVIGLAGFIALVAVQVRSILRAAHPGLRAVEALATSVPYFLLLFAGTYVSLAAQSPGSFGAPLSHTQGLYFTVTVFSTVGFGDITAKTDTAQLMVTVQMLADLVVFGLAVKVVVGAVRRGRERRNAEMSARAGAEDGE